MKTDDLALHLVDPARLAALRAVALLDTPTEESFDRLSWLAARFLNAPVALVSLLDANRQFFKSCIGLPEPWSSRRETPLSHSFCQHNRIAGQPLLIEDARTHPLVKDNLAIRDLHVIAYLGFPLVTSDGYVLGSFCVIDTRPRRWGEEDVTVIRNLSVAVMTEIQLRTEIAARFSAERECAKQTELNTLLHREITARKQAEESLRESEKKYRQLSETLEKRVKEAVDELRDKDKLLIIQSKQAVMGELLSNIAHHWRQPLNMLGLLAQELPVVYERGEFSAEYLSANAKKTVGIIQDMSKTIDYFRDFFKPDKEKVQFSALEVIKKVVTMLEGSSASHGIKTEVKVTGEPVINGYPSGLAQILLNIISNARDAFLERETDNPTIIITAYTEGGKTIVTISDNAGGIPEGIIDKIFDPYFTSKGPDKGTGLGLYMSKTIIEKSMNGTLKVRNVGDGAEFRMELYG